MTDGSISIAISGDAIIRTRPSLCADPRFLALVEVIRAADAAYTHLELPIHDYRGPELYPAAEAGHNWARAPRHAAAELKWAGFDIVSTASNHILDFSYGGLFSTWEALRAADLPFAGTGMDLGEARAPAYLETARGRVALVSMCSSFVRWSRAGETHRDMGGRPGVNPLRYHHVVDRATFATIRDLGIRLGWIVEQHGDRLIVSQAGTQNSIQTFVGRDEPGVSTAADEDDLAGNLRSIRLARTQADHVIAHLHSHDFHPERGLAVAPDYVVQAAKASIDAGADVFIAQGAHAPVRGIEIYNGKPIFYDPGEIIASNAVHTPRLPADFYQRAGYGAVAPQIRHPDATAADGFAAMHAYDAAAFVNPAGGLRIGPVKKSCVLAVCRFDAAGALARLELHPVTYLDRPKSQRGIPILAEGALAEKIIGYMAELSAPYGTKLRYENGIGILDLA